MANDQSKLGGGGMFSWKYKFAATPVPYTFSNVPILNI